MCIRDRAKNGLKGAKIKFPTISVGATENALLAAFKAKGKTILKNCAIEPEIRDLIKFLKKLGSDISIKGRTISISERKVKSSKIIHRVIFDRIELGTYMIASALLAKKNLTINKIVPKIVKNELNVLKKIWFLQWRFIKIFISSGVYPPLIRNRKRNNWNKKK